MPKRDISDRLASEPTGWRPNPGDKLIGTVIEIATAGANSDYGTYPLIVVETQDGREVAVHAFHTVLRNAIEANMPSVGDIVGIAYKGKVEGGAHGTFEDYRFILDRADT